MSGVGPVEPGEGTLVREAPPPRPRGRLALHYERHRRTALASATALAALAGGGYLYASRPQPRPAPPPPYPSQAIDLAYVAPVTGPPGAAADGFSFTVLLSVRSGPPVTVTRLTQPYDGLSATSSPAAPFQTKSHSARKIIVTLRVTECEKAPRNPGLPFLDVTLRNARAIEAHSFILGTRYARDLSRTLAVACGNVSR
ncbi:MULTISPECIES: Tat pathway signal sequence domain protein [Streptomyces]|uniref:Tat pathway signal sequence domain protein n=1 Tax=Streptomyces TaxID=1883 RepID=UPI001291D684|nr:MULTISPECIES: Tat pathway signal sequence domain protein [Streptomyces]MCX5038459.1 Tat pathway signal sequence domain protein [Streptomyces coelicoflavus]QFX84510.1 Tat pathway signal sequence domain protein [Streptomyces sp. SYP-A7193]